MALALAWRSTSASTLATPSATKPGFYLGYPMKDALFDVIDRALGGRDDLDVPISAADGRDQGIRRQPAPGALAGFYPANSAPRPGDRQGKR